MSFGEDGEGDWRPSGGHSTDNIWVDEAAIGGHDVGGQRCRYATRKTEGMPSMSVDPQLETLLRRSYAAFNTRDMDAAVATMHNDVDWPDMIANRRVVGREAVRRYWSAQFDLIDPTVTPTAFAEDAKGQIVVDVHQIVRDKEGNLLSEQDVQHVYSFEDGLAVAMDVYHDGALASAPRTSTRD